MTGIDKTPAGLTVYRLPRSHWHCHLWNFEWQHIIRPSKLEEYVMAFLHGIQDGKSSHMLLTGDPGSGKTHIGIGVYRVAAAVWGTELCTWLNVPAFCERVKRSYDPLVVDPWYDVEAAKRLVVLDDLFGKDLSPHEMNQILVRLLDTAYQNNAALLVTMNQSAEPTSRDLPSRLNPHEISRLLASAVVLPMIADKDWRRG